MLEHPELRAEEGPADGVGEHAPRVPLSPLAVRLDTLTTWLFWIAAVVLVLGFVAGAVILSTSFDTQGLVTPQTEGQGRIAFAAGVSGVLFAGAGTVAGLAGILRAIVRAKEL